MAVDTACCEDRLNSCSVKGVRIGVRARCLTIVLCAEQSTQLVRHVFGEMIRSERQLPASVTGPSNKSNSQGQCDYVRYSEVAWPRAQQPTDPTDDRQRNSAPHVLGDQPPGITS